MTGTNSNSSYILREYQDNLISQIADLWCQGIRRIMAQLATGGGKTVIFAALAAACVKRGKRVLVVAHREELILQAQEKLTAASGLPVGIIKAGHKPTPGALIQVASIQTLARRKLMPEARLVIIDEAHHSAANSYAKLIEHYHNSFILGVSATPTRTDGQGLAHLYDKIVLGISTKELIDQGYLCPYRLFAAPNAIDTSGIKTTAGDFDQQQLEKAVNTRLVLGDMLETWKKHAVGKKTVVFGVGVDHSMAIVRTFQEEGITAEHIDGSMSADERAAILGRFRSGETLVLSNCNIVSEGFDLPNIECIQCIRPTKSLILWLQMIGRALRPAPGKSHAIIIDHSQNFIFHGLPSDDRVWTLEAVSMDDKARRITVCTECNHIFRPLAHELEAKHCTCPNCGASINLEEGEGREGGGREIENDKSAEIKEIDTKQNPLVASELERLIAIQEEKEYKRGWVYKQLQHTFGYMSSRDWYLIGQKLGYKSQWAWERFREQKQSNERKSSNNDGRAA